jgi:hypothetical protein
MHHIVSTDQTIHSVCATTKYGLRETNLSGWLTISATAAQLIGDRALFGHTTRPPAAYEFIEVSPCSAK